MSKILLGFEVETGKEVYLPDGHTAITGMTQLSGKTTALEALVDRGNKTAITFLTKRGEVGFSGQRIIKPYYVEQTDDLGFISWMYVESILEATMGEKMRIERSFIVDACKNAHSLQEVYSNFKDNLENAKRGFDRAILTNLKAYFDIILPEIQKYDFSDNLDLKKGFNVMNLIELPEQMQQLVIRATIEFVYKNLKKIVLIIPEAHKFIPPSKTPVKKVALKLIREGAGIGNFVWIDSQETTSVDKQLLKQCSNWIMGYQQEKNEVNNVREHLGKRVKVDQITSLKLGHFVTSVRRKIYHIYILPSGIDPEIGRKVALGELEPEYVKNLIQKGKSIGDDEMSIKRVSELEKELEDLKKVKGDVVGLALDLEKANTQNKNLEGTLERVNKEVSRLQDEKTQNSYDSRQKIGKLEAEIKEKNNQDSFSNRYMEGFKALIVEVVTPMLKSYTPSTLVQVPDVVMGMPSSMVNTEEILGMVLQRIQGEKKIKVIKIDIDEAVHEVLSSKTLDTYKTRILKLTQIHKDLALHIRKLTPISATNVYYRITGKSAGRVSGNFYGNLKSLEDAKLIQYDKTSKEVTWTLGENLNKSFDFLSEKQIKQIDDLLVSMLLPVEVD